MRDIILYLFLEIGVLCVVFGLWYFKDKITSIFTGWWHYIFSSDKVEKMAKKRAAFCNHCKHNKMSAIDIIIDKRIPQLSGRHCGECSCPLSTKLRSKFEECPIGLWKEEN